MLNQPLIDGTILPAHPADLMRAGRVNKVDLINGSTRDEGTFFAALMEAGSGKPMDDTSYAAVMTQFYGKDLAPRVIAEYPAAAYPTPTDAYASAVTASLFACPGRAMNDWMSGYLDLYAYEFSDRTAPSYAEPVSFALGAAHTFELPYLFPGFNGAGKYAVQLNDRQERLSTEMIGYWAAFAQGKMANKGWHRYRPADENMLIISLPSARMTSTSFSLNHKCEFWDKTGLYYSPTGAF